MIDLFPPYQSGYLVARLALAITRRTSKETTFIFNQLQPSHLRWIDQISSKTDQFYFLLISLPISLIQQFRLFIKQCIFKSKSKQYVNQLNSCSQLDSLVVGNVSRSFKILKIRLYQLLQQNMTKEHLLLENFRISNFALQNGDQIKIIKAQIKGSNENQQQRENKLSQQSSIFQKGLQMMKLALG
ncbi:hypothetical protein pb186bvf_002942 [Paramecium bursaria]